MKTAFQKFFITIILTFIVHTAAFSELPTYNLVAKNFHVYGDSLTFGIYLIHTNPGVSQFKYAAGQYFFRFNPAISNSGTLTYRIVGSDLDEQFRPRNPSISGSELRLATNNPSVTGAPIISSNLPGTLVVKMSLRTSAASLDPTQPLSLAWKSAAPGFFTKLSCFNPDTIVEITNPASYSIDSTVIGINPISAIIPGQYKLYQNYPNPFNPSTNIKFDVPENAKINLTVFDISGREAAVLVNEKLQPVSTNTNGMQVTLQAEFIFTGFRMKSLFRR
jgi:hypothetical protein